MDGRFMSKTKDEFIAQMHERVFQAWWKDNESRFPLTHTKDAKDIFVSGRICFEEQFMKQKDANQKIENKARKLQSFYDKLKEKNDKQ